ncbi:MAG: hypothetical protein ACOYOU_14665 [Kiritimatiellia bacterium]
MKKIRLICLALLVLGLFAVLQLPDVPADRPEQRYLRLPENDFAANANRAWLAGQRGTALLLLDYATEQRLVGATNCTQMRAVYLAALLDDTTPGGSLTIFGLAIPATGVNGYQGLAGQSVSDYFAYGGGAQGWQSGNSPDVFQTLVRESRNVVVSVFPPAGPALILVSAARANEALHATLVNQLSQALQFVRTEPTNALAAFAVQESVMPIQQLGRPCKSWAVFQLLLRSAASVDQVKLLARVAAATPESARKLAQILAVTETAAPDLTSLCIGFVMQHGVAGLNNLHAALAKGPAGLQLVLRIPALPAATLNATALDASNRQGFGGTWWETQQAQLGRVALLLKYVLTALLCAAIFVLLIPWPLFRDTFAPATPLAGLGVGSLFRAYWLAIVLAALAVCLLLMLPAVTPPLPTANPAVNPELSTGANGTTLAVGGVAVTADKSQAASLVLLLLAILIVQGGCYWIARRKIREVELGVSDAWADKSGAKGDPDAAAVAALKLRRLENLDIFFDLPLYCGLALTIFAFILITTFGAGVSRFLAYGSTFVGIIFAVILRVAYLYPLREKLINRLAR